MRGQLPSHTNNHRVRVKVRLKEEKEKAQSQKVDGLIKEKLAGPGVSKTRCLQERISIHVWFIWELGCMPPKRTKSESKE